ncbi:hypothetical protein J5N97_010533 [Dioscorea zingiberensis]|uniref:Uncharacterized protein n=1 Tax=Dioscorea zingiberensis TaxID=325984 RepID=A0A9D5HMR4_9LILI|nr:hypothetical protein J5N97_010533 [Dioscorea zingiberensis]
MSSVPQAAGLIGFWFAVEESVEGQNGKGAKELLQPLWLLPRLRVRMNGIEETPTTPNVKQDEKMAGNKMTVVALLLISMLVFSATPALSTPGCIEDCVNRCSNGKNLVSCGTMCAAACVKPDGKDGNTPSDPYQG